jgi:hypothetical protein
VEVKRRNEALDCRMLNIGALGALLSTGLDLSREAGDLAARVHAAAVGAQEVPQPPGSAGA